jgi:hypothetical protein
MLQGVPFNYGHLQHTISMQDTVPAVQTFRETPEAEIHQAPTNPQLPIASQQFWSSPPL